tara:strand:+ start:1195 stop:1326 length:132 start_codon:yes stop_codon:yes gene_type:complete
MFVVKGFVWWCLSPHSRNPTLCGQRLQILDALVFFWEPSPYLL